MGNVKNQIMIGSLILILGTSLGYWIGSKNKVAASNESILRADLAKSNQTNPKDFCHQSVSASVPKSSALALNCHSDGTHGSELVQAVTASIMNANPGHDISLQNFGLVRRPLLATSIAQKQVLGSIPFDNKIVSLKVQGAQLHTLLEGVIDLSLTQKAARGAYPYASGLRFTLDLSKKAGERLTDIQVKDKSSGNWVALEDARTYDILTSDFLAKGNDGYTILSNLPSTVIPNSSITRIVSERLDQFKTLDMPLEEYSTRQVIR